MSAIASVDPAAMPCDVVAAAAGVDPQRGLSACEAARRLERDGPNAVGERRRPPYARIAARQIADPLTALLIGAAAVSTAIGERTDAGVILAIVVLNAVLGFVQEAGAERALLALTGSVALMAQVVRDGRTRTVPVEELVVGDVVLVGEGERVPADARLLAGQRLAADESALTGESVPVDKRPGPVASATALAERTSMLFAGTGVTRGRATAIVVATGPRTELGRIATLVAQAHPPPTPLQRRLARLARAMVVLGLAITALLAGGLLLRGSSLREAFLVAVAVAVAAVPEGLAATVTIALAQGARAMARRGAIVRRLAAVETLGATTVIATDKTGTLTCNQLRLVAVEPAPGATERDVLRVAALASTAELVDGEPHGDPIDVAVVRAARERGIAAAGAPVCMFPFDPGRGRQTAVHAVGDGFEITAKGAPERLLDLTADPLAATLDAWTADGRRVLAVVRRHEGAPIDDEPTGPFDSVGLVAFEDPLRPTAARAVALARDAGVRTIMLTGDHAATAAAIARRAGIPAEGVFARVTPEDKLTIARSLQAGGDVVAVTGDGVNDAPALRAGDVGVAMGRSGTEAAREAADIVLTDDDYATIVAAVAEGRRIGANLRKFVAFLLSANVGEVVLFAVAVAGGLGTPMTVVQVLVVNLVTDGLPALALARDPLGPAALERGPLPAASLFSRSLEVALGLAGLAVGAAATVAYLVGRANDTETARTMAFATIVIAELLFVFSCRSETRPAWRSGPAALLVATVGASLIVAAAGIYTALGRDLLGTVALDAGQAAVVVALALAPSTLVEAAKAVRSSHAHRSASRSETGRSARNGR